MFCYTLLAIDILLAAALATLYACRWRDYALPARINAEKPDGAPTDAAAETTGTRRLCSVVVPAHDQGELLEKHLPLLLDQDFPAGRFEVVVVDDASTDCTADVLKRLENEWPHLRHTFVPPSARFIPRLKLAITLGIRAARSPWVVLTLPDCRPAGRDWLRTMYANCTEETDFITGHASFADDGTRRARRAIYENLRYRLSCWRAARGGSAIGADVRNLGIRKAAFLEKRGFAGHLTSVQGEGDMLVCALASPGRTAVELRPGAVMRRQLPDPATLAAERMCRHWLPRVMGGRCRRYRRRAAVADAALLCLLCCVAARLAVLASSLLTSGTYAARQLCYDVPFLLMLIAALTVPVVLMRKGTRSMGERAFGLSLPHYALWQPLRDFLTRLMLAGHRRDFVRGI